MCLSVNGFPLLVGCGTDGASVNIAEQNGMKGKLQAGYTGHGAMPTGLSLPAMMPFPVIFSVT